MTNLTRSCGNSESKRVEIQGPESRNRGLGHLIRWKNFDSDSKINPQNIIEGAVITVREAVQIVQFSSVCGRI